MRAFSCRCARRTLRLAVAVAFCSAERTMDVASARAPASAAEVAGGIVGVLPGPARWLPVHIAALAAPNMAKRTTMPKTTPNGQNPRRLGGGATCRTLVLPVVLSVLLVLPTDPSLFQVCGHYRPLSNGARSYFSPSAARITARAIGAAATAPSPLNSCSTATAIRGLRAGAKAMNQALGWFPPLAAVPVFPATWM